MKPRLVFTAAVMDLLHEGHLNLLRTMRGRGDLTLVILHDARSTFWNKGKFPIEHLDKRTKNLIDTGLVDIVQHTFMQQPVHEFLAVIDRFSEKFELLFMRGDDWKGFPGHEVLESNSIPVEFVPYTKGVSSTSLRKDLTEA